MTGEGKGGRRRSFGGGGPTAYAFNHAGDCEQGEILVVASFLMRFLKFSTGREEARKKVAREKGRKKGISENGSRPK